MTLNEACLTALTILKQVMEEKLNSTNVEVSFYRSIGSSVLLIDLLVVPDIDQAEWRVFCHG